MAEKLEKSMLLPLTQSEFEVIQQLQKLNAIEARNVVRRAVRMLAQSQGIKLEEGVFADRKQGNRLPKKRKQPEG